tara:strand:- start:715 stop:858 length:144 start_codon:yes stop_codon:yes gene_type:complete
MDPKNKEKRFTAIKKATGKVNKVTCFHEHKHEQPKKIKIPGTKDVKF